MPSPFSSSQKSSRVSSSTPASSSSLPSPSPPPPQPSLPIPSRQANEQAQRNPHRGKLSLAVPQSNPTRTTNATTAPSQLVNSVLAPNSATSLDLSAPSSTTSATTSFRIGRAADVGGGASSSTSAPGRRSEDIEMGPITPAGHRRRRSTLTAGGSSIPHGQHQPSASRASRGPSNSLGNPALEGDAKISEEGGDGDASKESPSDDSLSDEDLHDDEETGLTKKDRKRKRSKRRRNTRLDQRIARDKLSEEERKEADQNVARSLAINAVLIGLWYLFSLSISLHSSDLGRSRHETEPERPAMTKMFYLTRIGPCGAATGLDIGLGNTSLKFITLTFYTMCKSSSLAFVLLFAFVFRLETPTLKLIAIIATMTAGVVMMVAGEVEFKLNGFVLVISAAFFSGFRWGLTQILLLRNPATSNPFSSIFFLAPVMFATLTLIAIPVEGVLELVEGLRQLSAEWGAIRTPMILLFPGTIAFLMTASEFALLKRSSVVTLSIAGIFKEVLTISVAALVFDDRLTPINISGLIITIGAIAAYNWIKLSKMRNEAQMDVQNKDGYQQAQSGSSSSERGGSSDSDEEEAGLLAHKDDDYSSAQDDFNLVTAEGDVLPGPLSSHPVGEFRAHPT
ncbi:hypothetical protein DL764_007058 [Monosporascus ibericus]|uniref:Sugar phosphate transporter domain-containing protein n=1 Tax=Monosporascus ibericus TaxID=155417 RepID=A0A4Q4T6N3_9PEZI|nr:hypothetical protein DL764_007058 [Monosporascus ibericus]